MPLIFTCLICIACIFMNPAKALALQLHLAPGSLYAHQMAHAFFMFSMGAFSFWLQKNRLIEQKGWRYIQISALFFILWNIDTFTVHVIREAITSDMFIGSARAWDLAVDLSTVRAKIFYAGKILDHVFLVSAVWAFLAGIISFREEPGPEEW